MVFLNKEDPLFLTKYGDKSWVFITGATDGIGWSYCQEFAKRGFNVIIVSREQEKLNRREKELNTSYP